MGTCVCRQPKASVFNKLGTRLNNQISFFMKLHIVAEGLRIRTLDLYNLCFCCFHLFSEAEKQNRMAALLERLHAKHNASRPWQETCKVVRQAMVRKSHPFLRENPSV